MRRGGEQEVWWAPSSQPGSSHLRGISNKCRKTYPDKFLSKFFKLGNIVMRAEHRLLSYGAEGKLGHLNGILNWKIYSISSLTVFYTRWKCFKSSPWFIAKFTPWVSVSEHSQDSECWLRDIFISQWSNEVILSACSRYPFPKQRHQTKVMLFLHEIPAQLSHFKEYQNQSFSVETEALIWGIIIPYKHF